MKKIVSMLALMGLIMAGCGGSGEESEPAPAGKDAVIFSLGSKTISGAPELNTALDWKSGNVLGIYCSRIAATANYKATLTGSSYTSKFKFNGTDEHTFYLYAPYNSSGLLSNKTPKITGKLPSDQNARTTIADNALVYSKTIASPADGLTVSAEFKHAFAYAGFKVTASQHSSYRLKAVVLAAENAVLSGAYTADLQASSPISFASEANNYVKVNADASQPLSMSSAQTVYAVLNPQPAAKDFEIAVYLENPADGSAERFVSTITGKTFAVQALTSFDLDIATMTNRESIDIDFGQTSAVLWGGLASIQHAGVAAIRNDVRTTPDNYGIRYRKAGTSDEWISVTAADGKSSTPSLVSGQTYEYEVWVKFKTQMYYSGQIEHFTEGLESRNFYKNSFVLKFTGLWCHNCPAMTFSLAEAQTRWPDRIVGLEIHADQNTGMDPYEVPNTNKIINRYGISGFPQSIMDSRALIGNGNVATVAPIFVNVGKESLTNFAPSCGITFSSSLSSRTLSVETKIYVKDADTYLLNVVLVEDITTMVQLGFTGEFPLHNVARVFMTDILGETMNAAAGTIYNKSFTCSLPASAVPANCKVLIYVMRKYNTEHPRKDGVTGAKYNDFGGYYVDNCSVASIGAQTLLKYEVQ